ncbi:MAG TPA: peptidoglycan DD-metalloendopeptidase family protein [Acidimicrobiales bacterium]|jgi:murein DD-endopeptidase MepM/ murein hydrolase activator NlpD|nr:peptidoglycan DD-metalloendopeptidase family protein [Acidimicrobiales bacterium]
MSRLRALVIAALVVVGTAVPAAAQTLPVPPDSTPETTPDSTPTTPPDSTVPEDTTPESTPDTTPTTLPAVDDPGINGDAPPESVPQNDVSIPDPTIPPGKPDAVLPPRARVVQIDAQAARASALLRQAAYNGAVARRQELEGALAEVQLDLNRLDGQSRDAVRNLTDAHKDLVERAVYAYVRGGDEARLWSGSDDTAAQRTALLSAVADRDQAAISRYQDAKAQVTRDQAEKVQSVAALQAELDLARVAEAQAQTDLNSAQLEVAVTTAGGNIVIHGFVFPVASPHSFNEDFGAPRLPGTAQAHSHQGCDVVAAEGTELFAAERGIVTQLSSGGLGGNGLWIKGESGTSYYYAHLSAYVLGLASGQLVEAGQLVGYVGHTGDAYGPHLHFEVHPNGGPAVDPYPILLVADPQRALAARP